MGLELSKYHIDFEPHRTFQAQVLVDFVVENTLLSAMETHEESTGPKIRRKLACCASMARQDNNIKERDSYYRAEQQGVILRSKTRVYHKQ